MTELEGLIREYSGMMVFYKGLNRKIYVFPYRDKWVANVYAIELDTERLVDHLYKGPSLEGAIFAAKERLEEA